MDSRPSSQPLRCLVFVFVIVHFCMTHAQNFDSLTQRVPFYPAPLISHSPKPLTFYAEKKLLNIHTVFNFTELGGSFTMSDKSYSVPLEKSFDQIIVAYSSQLSKSCSSASFFARLFNFG